MSRLASDLTWEPVHMESRRESFTQCTTNQPPIWSVAPLTWVEHNVRGGLAREAQRTLAPSLMWGGVSSRAVCLHALGLGHTQPTCHLTCAVCARDASYNLLHSHPSSFSVCHTAPVGFYRPATRDPRATALLVKKRTQLAHYRSIVRSSVESGMWAVW